MSEDTETPKSADVTGRLDGLVSRLRALARDEHDDFSIADEAADEIIILTERLRAEKEASTIWEHAFNQALNEGNGSYKP